MVRFRVRVRVRVRAGVRVYRVRGSTRVTVSTKPRVREHSYTKGEATIAEATIAGQVSQ